jgi:hypothetical protein
MITALWGWLHAAQLVGGAGRPDVALWAVRSGAVALAAGAQALLLTFVVGSIYAGARRDRLTAALNGAAALVFMIALVGAAALGLVGR